MWFIMALAGASHYCLMRLLVKRRKSLHHPNTRCQDGTVVHGHSKKRMVAKNSVLHSRIQGPGSKGNLISHESNINEVVEEISIRNCSNPEDRVLSMLKLLGVEQMLQVRTGRTLQGQLIELGRSLLEAEQEEMLLKLCLVDPFGNGMPGMSWMPAFEVKKGSWQEEARYLRTWMSLSFRFMDFKYNKATSMRCLGISNVTGELEMEGHVCTGHLIFCEHDKSMQEYRVEEFDERDKSFYEKYQSRTAVLQVDGQAVFHLCARVSVKTTCYLQGVDRDQRWAYSYIAFPTPDVHALQQIPVYMVALGNVEKNGNPF
ncbi:hypothetical protein KP509_13G024200 [Ceratopteris richardii]|uniref:Uncharacterized protein n=1 Tax=Ceratopteris richardii TaxID=49495 RepID=A0A8T2TG59_CERRI|nr:hypothetical protein KP509_13G024200 [Ceratopteris richardii]